MLDTDTTTVTVRFTIEESVSCDVEAELDVPLDLLGDREELLSWLEDNDDAWVDDIDPATQQVLERSLIKIEDVHRAAA